jgi:MoaA/NifB/PqqE/SkfB family radical SAM enzyme
MDKLIRPGDAGHRGRASRILRRKMRTGLTILLDKITSSGFLSDISYWGTFLLPEIDKINKYKNLFKVHHSINHFLTMNRGNPLYVRIAPIALCNYKCLFCEIHKDNLLYPNRSKNIVKLEDIYNYEAFLSTALTLSFYGGSAEPLLNMHFGEIVAFLKNKYNMKMDVNTNASTLNNKLADIFLQCGFDDIIISYHAATKELYKMLMTGDIARIDNNIAYITSQKREKNLEKPVLYFNFGLQKLNAGESTAILDKARRLGIDSVIINRYYGGRNKLQDMDVSFDYDAESGNKILAEIYEYAKVKSIKLTPDEPRYWDHRTAKIVWNPANIDRKIKCYQPWTSIHFNPVLDEANCHYIGICNRIELFKINYRKFKLNSQENFDKIWNHPVIQYLRATVNSDNLNPICYFCKNKNRERVRNIDEDQYAEIRDNAVVEFFEKFNEKYEIDAIEGVELLVENPHSDKIYKELRKNSVNSMLSASIASGATDLPYDHGGGQKE